jgi:hypothetical protein
MHVNRRLMTLVALSGSMFIGGFTLPGCSGGSTQTGTLVERTPEQVAAEKASIEGMKKAMMKAQGQSR